MSVIIDSANRHDSKLLIPHIVNIKKYLNTTKVMATDCAENVKNIWQELAKINLVLFVSTNVRRDKTKKKLDRSGVGESNKFLVFSNEIAA